MGEKQKERMIIEARKGRIGWKKREIVGKEDWLGTGEHRANGLA